VQGAAPACRRYVVTITKDGWLTTALPMEKCGATQAGRVKPPLLIGAAAADDLGVQDLQVC
jgi:hypothetical protein